MVRTPLNSEEESVFRATVLEAPNLKTMEPTARGSARNLIVHVGLDVYTICNP
jgi:hypothetical protein